MRSLRIDSYSFGTLVINGVRHESDLLIYPEGKIVGSWRRKRGHQLSINDMTELIESAPEVIVVGTGIIGMMKPEKGLNAHLSRFRIESHYGVNKEAMQIFNELVLKKRVGACFHLTC